jgi:hypothetical protein
MWAPLVRSSPVRNCLPRELTECHHTQPRSPRWSHGRGGSLDQDPTCQPGTAVVFGRNDHCHCRALQLAERLQPPSLPTRGAYNPLGAPSAQGIAQPGWPTPERECIERERERAELVERRDRAPPSRPSSPCPCGHWLWSTAIEDVYAWCPCVLGT